jgi:hypothetical protein
MMESAFMFVNSAGNGMNSAVVCKDTGKILYRSDMAGIDEIEDEEDLNWERFKRLDSGLRRSYGSANL